MKRFMVLAVVVFAVFGMVCSAGAADFSGKWTNTKLSIVELDGSVSQEMDFDSLADSDDELGYAEIRDGKAFVQFTGDDEIMEFTVRESGDKLVAELTEDLKEEGFTSVEFYFEDGWLVLSMALTIEDESGFIVNYYRRPK